MSKSEVYMVAGDAGPPWLLMSKAGFARLGEAIARYKVKVRDSYRLGEVNPRNDFVVSLTIPAQHIEDVARLLNCKLTYGPDIQIGMEVAESVKWKDENGVKYYSEYPSKERPVGDPK